MPKISVIIPSYNHEKYISEAIQSVLDQTFQDFEIVIVDDGSTDNTVAKIKEFDDPRIRLFCFEQNRGACVAANKLIAESLGEYVAVLSSDDVFLPEKLEKQVEFLDANSEYGAVFSYAQIIDEDGEPFTDETHPNYHIFHKPNRTRYEWLNHFFYYGNCLCHPSVLIRKECYTAVGGYDERLAQLPDFDFWIRLCFKFNIYVLQEPLVKFRIRSGELNASGNRLEVYVRTHYELYQILNHYLRIDDFAGLIKIFPEGEKYFVSAKSNAHFALASIALKAKDFRCIKLWGLNVLFNLLDNPEQIIQLGTDYQFSFKNFIELTAEHDTLGVKAVAERDGQIGSLNQAVAERDGQIGSLNQAVAERDAQITTIVQECDTAKAEVEMIFSSISWKITRPARTIVDGFRRAKVLLGADFWGFATRGAVGWYRKNRRLPGFRELRVLAMQAKQQYQLKSHVKLGSPVALSTLHSRLHMMTGESPLISVVMPVYKTPISLLRCAVDSVCAQIYQNWELCICDDGSLDPELTHELKLLAQKDKRIKTISLESNAGISKATNIAMEQASGDFFAFLDHDDELTPEALGEVVLAIRSNPSVDVIYTDQDKIDEQGAVFEQFHKPDWSPDYFRRVMYVGHLLVVRKTLVQVVEGFDSQFDGVQDYEFMLRLSEQTSNIVHIPKILYHWRAIQGSFAFSSDAKGKVEKIQCEAVRKHLDRLGLDRDVIPHPVFPHRVQVSPSNGRVNDKISIVIPTKDQPEHIRRCLSSIFNRTSYKNFEVIVIDNGTVDKDALEVMQQYPIQVVQYNEPFNYSKVNNIGVANSSGDVVVLLNNDIEVVTKDWLEILLGNLDQKDVGAVGPMLIYPDNTVQHAGIVLGARGTVDHVMRGFPYNCDGYAGSLSCAREVSAVTGACLMTRKQKYLELGGLVEHYGTHYQDADFCLQLRKSGLRVLHIPDAHLIHFESATRGSEYDLLDRLLFQDRWADLLLNGDPYFNPAFSLDKLDYSINR